MSPKEEGGLLAPYKSGLRTEWGVIRDHLDDLYIRFLRVAERRITEVNGEGIVCFISSFSYLADPTAVVMRQRYLAEFDVITIDNLNGDSRETGKTTPDGQPDPSIFSTPYSKAGIQVGTAISLLARKRDHEGHAIVKYRDFWGAQKREDLFRPPTEEDPVPYTTLTPTRSNRYSFRPSIAGTAYYDWVPVTDLCAEPPTLGLNENRGGALTDMDRSALVERMRIYLDPSASFENLPPALSSLQRSWARFDPEKTRARLLKMGGFSESRVLPFIAKPLDLRWAYVDTTRKLWNEPRPELVRHGRSGQSFLVVRRRAPRANDGAAFLFAECLGDQHCLHKDAYFVPFNVGPLPLDGEETLFEEKAAAPKPNLSDLARSYLATLGVSEDDPGYAELIWLHALAIGYSPRYLLENEGGIRFDWPRIPLPGDASTLRASAELGREVACLVDPRATLPSVTKEPLRPTIKAVGSVRRVDGEELDPDVGHLKLTAGWGIRGRNGVVMPGAGRLGRRPLEESSLARLDEEQIQLLGGEALDVYLNEHAYWRDVPMAAWEMKIGGYQVAKKWLSYRELRLLGRSLTIDEVREFTGLVRRLTSLVLLTPELNRNYEAARTAARTLA